MSKLTGEKQQSQSSSSDKGEAALKKAKPVKLRIPSAKVSTDSFIELSSTRDRGNSFPAKDAMKAAWYSDSVTPGERGIAILAARYATAQQPGLMKDISAIRVGDSIHVGRADGSTASFKITKVQQLADGAMPPTTKKEAATTKAELRFVTFGVLTEPLPKPKSEGTKSEEDDDAENPNQPVRNNIAYFAEMSN